MDVFFVLSGFLITTLLLEERAVSGRVSLRSFYARRALRLLPAVIALLAVLAVLVVAGALGGAYTESAPWVLLYVANWWRIVGEATPLVHLWSLSVEEQFYVLWPPLLLALVRFVPSWRSRALTLGAISVAVLLARTLLYAGGAISAERAYFGTDLRADALLMGCALALLRQGGATDAVERWAERLLWPALAGLAVVMVLPMSLGGLGPVAIGPVDVASVVVVTAVVTDPHRLRVLGWSPMVRLGVLSYGFYLWHYPVMSALGSSSAARFFLGIPISLGAAWLSHRVVEAPALRMKRRFERRLADPATQVGGEHVQQGTRIG